MNKKSNPANDAQLEQELLALDESYRSLSNVEPPAMVDQAVLNLARREADSQHRSGTRRKQWIAVLSSFALLVITLNLVVDQQPESPQAEAPTSESGRAAPAALKKGRESERRLDQPAEYSAMRSADVLSDESPQSIAAEALEFDYRSDPESWLEHISRLQQEGLTDQAQGELQAFEDSFPDYPLPDTLR